MQSIKKKKLIQWIEYGGLEVKEAIPLLMGHHCGVNTA